MENRELLNEIIEKHGKMVSSLCTRMIRDKSVAEDAAQEIWLEIMKSIESFENRSKLSTWIYTIAKRVLYKFTKTEKTYSTTYLSNYFRNWEEGEIDFPDEREEKSRFIKEQCDSCMVGILHCLDNDARLKYIMRDITNLSYDNISKIFDKSEPAIRKNISRSRKKLRMFLNDECYLYNPEGDCQCRMKEAIKDIDLVSEYRGLRDTADRIDMYGISEELFPRKNYCKIS